MNLLFFPLSYLYSYLSLISAIYFLQEIVPDCGKYTFTNVLEGKQSRVEKAILLATGNLQDLLVTS